MNKRRIIKILISILIAIIPLIYFFKFVDFNRVAEMARRISWIWLTVSYLIFLGYQWVRGLRFQQLVDAEGQSWKFFNTQCLHSFLNNSLPAGLGEVSLVYLLERYHGVKYHYGTASLLVARFIDLTLFTVLFFLLILFFWHAVTIPLIAIMIGVLGILAIATIVLRALFAYERKITLREGIAGKIHYHISSFLTAMRDVLSRGGHKKIVLYSMLMWMAMYLFFLSTIRALGFPLTWFSVLILYLMLFPIQLLPVKGVANFGTHELPWFMALQLLGMNTSDAAILGFGSHIIFLLIVIITAVIPLIYYFVVLRFKERNNVIV